MIRIYVLLLIIICFMFYSLNVYSDSSVIEQRLSYLKDLDDVEWVRFDRNNVYIGFSKAPYDIRSVVCAAAMHGNRAYGWGVHVWAVPSDNPNYKAGDVPYYCEATARYGKIEHTNCR